MSFMDNNSGKAETPDTQAEIGLNISAVERDTGLSKDTLRMWERRYGFPQPARDPHGERIYPLAQVKKLQLIKRLMDAGLRPGKIITHSAEDLAGLAAGKDGAPGARREAHALLELLRGGEPAELRCRLSQALMKQGLEAFVIDTVAPLNRAVGEAWMQGELAVFEEHLYTAQVTGVLRSAIGSMPTAGRPPRVLLTTFPGEQHGLGLLMAEALLTIEGVACIALGTETPLPEIAHACLVHRAEVVALSFSAAFNEKQASAGLTELRAILPRSVEVWAGGAAAARMRRAVPGVDVIAALPTITERVNRWRTANADRASALTSKPARRDPP
jgi:MerR family transcriptional regulator, light-induced transcriptional regulator